MFNGQPNATFTRKLHEPIPEAMVMAAANGYGYRYVSRHNAAGDITYQFTKA